MFCKIKIITLTQNPNAFLGALSAVRVSLYSQTSAKLKLLR